DRGAAVHDPARYLPHSQDLSRRDDDIRRPSFLDGKNRLDLVLQALDLPTEAVRQCVDRLRQTDVADAAVADPLFELRHGESSAHLPLKGQATERGILPTVDVNELYPLAYRAQRQWQRVHGESRIDACPDERHAPLFRRPVELPGDLRRRLVREPQLLAGRHHEGA